MRAHHGNEFNLGNLRHHVDVGKASNGKWVFVPQQDDVTIAHQLHTFTSHNIG